MIVNFRNKTFSGVLHRINPGGFLLLRAACVGNGITPAGAIICLCQPFVQCGQRFAGIGQHLHAVELAGVKSADVNIEEIDVRILEQPF